MSKVVLENPYRINSSIFNSISGKELDGNEVEVTLAKPVDKDHRQAKAAAKAMSGICSYPPYDYASYGIPYNNQFFMYNALPGGYVAMCSSSICSCTYS